jgi:hypothetical protein
VTAQEYTVFLVDPLSKKLTVIRYGAVLTAMCAVVIGYRIATTGVGLGSLVAVVFFAIICLKYPFFDMLVRMVRHRWPKLKVLPWLWIGYGAAASVDVVVTWIGISDESGANLAGTMTILLTPWFLAGALMLMALHTLLARKR